MKTVKRVKRDLELDAEYDSHNKRSSHLHSFKEKDNGHHKSMKSIKKVKRHFEFDSDANDDMKQTSSFNFDYDGDSQVSIRTINRPTVKSVLRRLFPPSKIKKLKKLIKTLAHKRSHKGSQRSFIPFYGDEHDVRNDIPYGLPRGPLIGPSSLEESISPDPTDFQREYDRHSIWQPATYSSPVTVFDELSNEYPSQRFSSDLDNEAMNVDDKFTNALFPTGRAPKSNENEFVGASDARSFDRYQQNSFGFGGFTDPRFSISDFTGPRGEFNFNNFRRPSPGPSRPSITQNLGDRELPDSEYLRKNFNRQSSEPLTQYFDRSYMDRDIFSDPVRLNLDQDISEESSNLRNLLTHAQIPNMGSLGHRGAQHNMIQVGSAPEMMGAPTNINDLIDTTSYTPMQQEGGQLLSRQLTGQVLQSQNPMGRVFVPFDIEAIANQIKDQVNKHYSLPAPDLTTRFRRHGTVGFSEFSNDNGFSNANSPFQLKPSAMGSPRNIMLPLFNPGVTGLPRRTMPPPFNPSSRSLPQRAMQPPFNPSPISSPRSAMSPSFIPLIQNPPVQTSYMAPALPMMVPVKPFMFSSNTQMQYAMGSHPLSMSHIDNRGMENAGFDNEVPNIDIPMVDSPAPSPGRSSGNKPTDSNTEKSDKKSKPKQPGMLMISSPDDNSDSGMFIFCFCLQTLVNGTNLTIKYKLYIGW